MLLSSIFLYYLDVLYLHAQSPLLEWFRRSAWHKMKPGWEPYIKPPATPTRPEDLVAYNKLTPITARIRRWLSDLSTGFIRQEGNKPIPFDTGIPADEDSPLHKIFVEFYQSIATSEFTNYVDIRSNIDTPGEGGTIVIYATPKSDRLDLPPPWRGFEPNDDAEEEEVAALKKQFKLPPEATQEDVEDARKQLQYAVYQVRNRNLFATKIRELLQKNNGDYVKVRGLIVNRIKRLEAYRDELKQRYGEDWQRSDQSRWQSHDYLMWTNMLEMFDSVHKGVQEGEIDPLFWRRW